VELEGCCPLSEANHSSSGGISRMPEMGTGDDYFVVLYVKA
jgi:hypothetical protein